MRRTRLKFSLAAMIASLAALVFFSGIALDQYNNTMDISTGVGFVIAGVLGVITAILQIYGQQETRRPSCVDSPLRPESQPDFEDQSDPDQMPKFLRT